MDQGQGTIFIYKYLGIITGVIPPRTIKFVIYIQHLLKHDMIIFIVEWFITTQSVKTYVQYEIQYAVHGGTLTYKTCTYARTVGVSLFGNKQSLSVYFFHKICPTKSIYIKYWSLKGY